MRVVRETVVVNLYEWLVKVRVWVGFVAVEPRV